MKKIIVIAAFAFIISAAASFGDALFKFTIFPTHDQRNERWMQSQQDQDRYQQRLQWDRQERDRWQRDRWESDQQIRRDRHQRWQSYNVWVRRHPHDWEYRRSH